MIGIATNQSEEQMRAKYESYIKSITPLIFKRGIYLLSSYKNVNDNRHIPIPIPNHVGIYLVNTNRSWFTNNKQSSNKQSSNKQSSTEGVVATIQKFYGPQTLTFNCVWFDADNLEEEEPFVFAEIEYIWRHHNNVHTHLNTIQVDD